MAGFQLVAQVARTSPELAYQATTWQMASTAGLSTCKLHFATIQLTDAHFCVI
jgi:hypothetical protein